MAAQKGLLPLPGEPARLSLGPSPGWGLYMGWDVALIQNVLVMSLKSQTDRDFQTATEEDHPQLSTFPGYLPTSFHSPRKIEL